MELLPEALHGIDPGQNTESLGREQFGSECGIGGGLRAVALEGHFGAVALEDVEETMARTRNLRQPLAEAAPSIV
ncbi:MAG: hypothetical protein ACR2KT_16035 [Methylocella sp.]|nr:MAG: hypothetical protein DLM68_08490 [Hyphomicrobiales bacterium]